MATELVKHSEWAIIFNMFCPKMDIIFTSPGIFLYYNNKIIWCAQTCKQYLFKLSCYSTSRKADITAFQWSLIALLWCTFAFFTKYIEYFLQFLQSWLFELAGIYAVKVLISLWPHDLSLSATSLYICSLCSSSQAFPRALLWPRASGAPWQAVSPQTAAALWPPKPLHKTFLAREWGGRIPSVNLMSACLCFTGHGVWKPAQLQPWWHFISLKVKTETWHLDIKGVQYYIGRCSAWAWSESTTPDSTSRHTIIPRAIQACVLFTANRKYSDWRMMRI